MIPVGYMAKRVVPRPEWLKAPDVQDIYSVSNCVSRDFLYYIPFWRHNGYWFFDHPHIIQELARENKIDLRDLTLFYYEVYEKEFDEEQKEWQSFDPSDFPTNVIAPTQKRLSGYDVVSFSMGTNPECSPLSCNHVASRVKTNLHCLLESFKNAKQGLEAGRFDHSEPGPFRIYAVYTIDTLIG
jgi:hypothetical protein